MNAPLVLNLDQIGMKNISGVSMPQGFAITTRVYWKFLRAWHPEEFIAGEIIAITIEKSKVKPDRNN